MLFILKVRFGDPKRFLRFMFEFVSWNQKSFRLEIVEVIRCHFGRLRWPHRRSITSFELVLFWFEWEICNASKFVSLLWTGFLHFRLDYGPSFFTFLLCILRFELGKLEYCQVQIEPVKSLQKVCCTFHSKHLSFVNKLGTYWSFL